MEFIVWFIVVNPTIQFAVHSLTTETMTYNHVDLFGANWQGEQSARFGV